MKKVFLCVLSLTLVLFSCKNSLVDVSKVSQKNYSEMTAEELAALDAEHTWFLSILNNSRTADTDNYPPFLYDLSLTRGDGTLTPFSELSDVEKENFASLWKKHNVEVVTEKLKVDPVLRSLVETDAEAFDMAYSAEMRSGCDSIDSFVQRYFAELDKVERRNAAQENSARWSWDKNKEDKNLITKKTLVQSSLNILKTVDSKNSIKGMVIATDDNGASSSGSHGHAAIIEISDLKNKADINGLTKFSYSSTPKGKGGKWENKADGVQIKPLGYWAGDAGTSAKTVSLYRVRDVESTTTDTSIETDSKYASEIDCNSAVDNANSYVGTKYYFPITNYLFTNPDDISRGIYCSQLVYLAWKGVSNKYILENQGHCVMPKEIMKSEKLDIVSTWKNI